MEIVLGRGFSVAVDGEITYKGLFSLRLHGLNVKKREEREREIFAEIRGPPFQDRAF